MSWLAGNRNTYVLTTGASESGVPFRYYNSGIALLIFYLTKQVLKRYVNKSNLHCKLHILPCITGCYELIINYL